MSFAKTFKLRHQVRGRDDAVRRLTLQEGELTLDSLRAKVAHLFALKDKQVWYFKWTDTDGDLVTLTEEYEFEEMISSKPYESVLKLEIFVEPPTPIEISIDAFFPRISPPQFTPFAASVPHPHPHPPQRHQPHPLTSKLGHAFCARCDVTNALLVPGSGNWYHRPGTRFDLCADEFNKLNADDQALFVLVSQPSDLADDIQAYATFRRRCHRFGGCPRKQEQKQQDEQPPKQPESSSANNVHPFFPPLFGQGPLSMEQLRKSVDSAVVAACDQTNQELRVGQGWYHKIGSNHDLCESAFNQLSDEDKGAFVRVESVEDLGEEVVRYLALPKPFQGLVQSFLGDLSNFGNLFAPQQQQTTANTTATTTSSETSEASSSTTIPPAPVTNVEPVQPRKQLHQLEIISGPSVVAGAKVKSGAHLFPVWEVKNASASASNMWTDVRIKPTAENPFQISESGFEAPALEAGASGLVSVDFIVPETLPSGPVRGDFVFVDSDGDIFGQPLSLVVDIVTPEDEKNLVLIRQLQDMGFSDEQSCKEALAANNGDINGAALALLRAQRF